MVDNNQRILEKLDKISDEITELKQEISAIKMQPEIADARFKNLELQSAHESKRISKLEDNQRWVVLAILGVVINAVMQLVIK